MFKKITMSTIAALALSMSGAFAAGGGEQYIEDYNFSFEGPFGTFDEAQLQRGLKVYTEVCAACHGLKYVPIRTLADEGGPHYSEDQVRAYAKNYEIYDAELEEFKEAEPSDHFPENNAVGAPDLSMMAKARAGFHGPYGTGISQLINGMGGAEYIASLLTGYTGKEKVEAGVTLYENTAFPGGWISMAPPLADGDVEFDDGHSNDLRHQSMDIAAFLMWAAEPKMMARQYAGFLGVFILVILSVLLYLTNKRIWAPIKYRKS